jgi:hypothetical protein
MNKIQIKDYLAKYKDSYSMDSIKKQLMNSGASSSDVDEVFSDLKDSSTSSVLNGSNSSSGSSSGLALGLAIGAWFIQFVVFAIWFLPVFVISLLEFARIFPFIGLFMAIYAIILAKKARKQNKDDGIALAALIISWIYIVLFIGFILLIVGLIGFQSWFTTFQNKQLNAIDMQTSSGGSSIEVSRVQDGIVYLLNLGTSSTQIDGLTITGDSGYICTSGSFSVSPGIASYPCDSVGVYVESERLSVLLETTDGLVLSSALAK